MTSLVSFGFPQRSRDQRGTLSALLHAKPLLWYVLLDARGCVVCDPQLFQAGRRSGLAPVSGDLASIVRSADQQK